MALLARAADRLYWGARYIERAEDTARLIRAYHELVVDFPGDVMLRWEPLAAITGNISDLPSASGHHDAGETRVLRYLIVARDNAGSIASCVDAARENLRTTREVLPREAWHAINTLSQYVHAEAQGAVNRQLRDRFLSQVIDDSRRLDGVVESTMNRDDPYRLLRLGRLVERADMTTRVLGVRAAGLLQLAGANINSVHDEVQWMGVLRSLSALQMYQRAVRGPIAGETVVSFLLFSRSFPRAVECCLDEIRSVLLALPSPDLVIAVLDDTEAALAECHPVVSDGVQLDQAMDRVQLAIAEVGRAIQNRYVGAA